MFNSFKSKLPQISIFHHASSPPSTKALGLLRSALSAPYPSSKPDAPPLEYNLEVVEAAPNSDQLRTILSYMPSKATSPSLALLSSHPSAGADRPDSVGAIAELVRKNPQALKWPIVVDWENGKAAVGSVDGVKEIIESVRKRRDGEGGGEDIDQPKGWFT